MENKANDRIERYIYQVKRQLPYKGRDDIEKELRSLISDMLEERCGGAEPSQKDIDIVLIELGDPNAMAAKYLEQDRYLIGPVLFPRYWMVLKIVLLCAAGGITLALIIGALADREPVHQFFAGWFSTVFSVMFGAFFWVTAIFACIENKDRFKVGSALEHGLDEFEKGIMGESSGGTFLDRLPSVPEKRAEIKRTEPIAGIIFTVLVMILFAFAPQLMGIYMPVNGRMTIVTTIFNFEVLDRVLWMFMTSMAFGMVREIVKLVEGRYTKRLALATVLCDVPALILCVFIFTRDRLFNDIIGNLIAVDPSLSDLTDISFILNSLGMLFLSILVFAFVLDMCTVIYKAYKYN